MLRPMCLETLCVMIETATLNHVLEAMAYQARSLGPYEYFCPRSLGPCGFHFESLEPHGFKNMVEAIRNVKSVYGVKRNWQGDPCAPKSTCRMALSAATMVTIPPGSSLCEDLSSSGLSGKIDSSLSNLESLQYLDLSNNSLTGEVPDFLSQLPLLKTLNLSGNEFTGSVPSLIIQRSKNGPLSLSVDGNPNLCVMASCNKKKSVVIPVIASIAVVLVLLSAFLILWGLKRRRQQWQGAGKDTPVLSWEQRLQIAVDAAQEMLRLPTFAWDGKLQAKVADFGLSRFMPSESRTIVSTKVAGTPSYLDPDSLKPGAGPSLPLHSQSGGTKSLARHRASCTSWVAHSSLAHNGPLEQTMNPNVERVKELHLTLL
ncbi:putative leucine-rich repeat receptor-like protein kinase [Vitis vinifera]|uniref:Putative leucine-rich repeat receptor-like protein kinase n=1 Tax=Vitis vinifera TaxID=29760 RepID=A0A438K7F8_VITVI|nr:putative leucine-rich repeat receptor-like protein kinase [Vitis vinifera]